MKKGVGSLTRDFIYWREMYFEVQSGKRDWYIEDESFFFRYKDGTVIYVNCLDNEDTVKSVDLRRVIYMVVEDGDDAIDSMGKSWSKDFKQDVDLWNAYRNDMLYRKDDSVED